MLVEASGLAWTFLRPTMYMNAALAWAPTVKQMSQVWYPMGSGRLAPIDPWDVAAAAAAALTRSGHAGHGYELTGPQLLTCADMVSTLSDIIGKQLTYIDIPEAAAREQMLKTGMAQYVVDGLPETFRLIRAGRFAHTTDVVEKLTARPPRSFQTWCREHVKAFT